MDKPVNKTQLGRSLLMALREYVPSPYAGSTYFLTLKSRQKRQLEQLDRSLAKLTIAQPYGNVSVPCEASKKAGTTVQTKCDTGDLINRALKDAEEAGYSSWLKNESSMLALQQGGNLEDKEMNRAIAPRFELGTYTQQARVQAPFQDFGTGAWIADLDDLPFVPDQLDAIIAEHASQLFSAAHFVTALFNAARVLYIPKEYRRAQSENSQGIELHNLYGSAQAEVPPGDSPSNLQIELLIVIVEEGAQIALNDIYTPQGFQARAVIGSIGPRAQVSYITDYRYDKSAYGLEYERWAIGADANLTRITGLTGGAQSWHMIDYTLGDRATIEHVALSAHMGAEQSALTSIQRHAGIASKSSVLVKSVLQEESQSFYRGTISIGQDAKQSEAHQQQRALILGSRARTCAIPSLEVATHDVRCSHGSAAGRFNDAEMHYLLSRGLDKDSAQRLLVEGFFNDEKLAMYATQVQGILKNLVARCRDL